MNYIREFSMRILSVGLLSLLILIPLSSAASVESLSTTLVQTVTSNNITGQSTNFVFSGDYVLWNNVGTGGGLYLYSRKDNSTRLIATEPASGEGINGYTISDGTVVWSNGESSLHEYAIASGVSQDIPDANTVGSQKTYSWNGINGIQRWEPSMYGDRVVWFQGYPEGTYNNADIAFLNTTTNEMTLINESPSAKGGLQINGDNVVWYAYAMNNSVVDNTQTSIYLHNLATGKDTVVSSDPGLKAQPSLSGEYIGWTDSGNPLAKPIPLSRVRIYTLSTGTIQTVPASSMEQFLGFISGDYAVYSECTPFDQIAAGADQQCQSKIFDIKTGDVWQYPQSPTDQYSGIWGYSNGLFLVADTKDGAPAFSLVTADNLPPADTITATPAPAMPGNNVTSLAGTTPSVPPVAGTPPAPTESPLSSLIPVTGVGAVCVTLGALRKMRRL